MVSRFLRQAGREIPENRKNSGIKVTIKKGTNELEPIKLK